MLCELFSRDRILTGVVCSDRTKLFSVMAEAAGSAYGTDFPFDTAVDALERREALMSTVIRPFIAIPHAKLAIPGDICGALAVIPDGVPFVPEKLRDATELSGATVRIAFMILSRHDRPDIHLATLKQLAALIDFPGFSDALMRSNDAQEAYETLRRHENLLRTRRER